MSKSVASKIDNKKAKAIADYRLSGNVSAVARKHKIARTTLLRWLKEYEGKNLDHIDSDTDSNPETAAVVNYINKTTDAAVRSIEAESLTRQEFLQQHYAGVSTLFSALITKMTAELNDKEKHPSLRDQAAALTALVNFVKEFTPTEEQGTTTINLLQQTVNKAQE